MIAFINTMEEWLDEHPKVRQCRVADSFLADETVFAGELGRLRHA